MRHNLLPLFCVLCAFCGCRITAQGSAVMVDDQGNVVAPPGVQLLDSVATTGGPFYPHFFDLEWQSRYRSTVTPLDTNTVEDAVIQTNELTGAIRDQQASILYQRNTTDAPYNYTSSDESVATVSSDGLVTHQSIGTVDITVTLADYQREYTLNMPAPSTVIQTNIVAGVDGYLRHALTDPIDSAIAADAGAHDDELFDSRDFVTHTYVRNASSWAYAATGGTDPWSAIAVWRTGVTATNHTVRGNLISPDVIACAWHNRPSVGTQYRWLGTDAQVYTRTVTDVRRVGSGDGCVVLLDSALPPEVVPLKILPADYAIYLLYRAPGDNLQIPAIALNKSMQAMATDVTGFFTSATNLVAGAQKSLLASREPYYQLPVSGDSGSPVMFVLDGDLILVLTWYTPWMGGAYLDVDLLTDAIDSLGGTQPTVVDLSSYPDSRPPTP